MLLRRLDPCIIRQSLNNAFIVEKMVDKRMVFLSWSVTENDCQDPMKKLGYSEFNGEQPKNKKWSDIFIFNKINLEARR